MGGGYSITPDTIPVIYHEWRHQLGFATNYTNRNEGRTLIHANSCHSWLILLYDGNMTRRTIGSVVYTLSGSTTITKY